ncbi:MAG TPA: Gfo/Idh/MocA family oxidoreductase [Steroidobacteraceae bacterium]|jgi:predicted dehydrogenase
MKESTPSPLRIGVLGAAGIARSFIAGVRDSALVSVTAVASRDAARATRFAGEMSVPRSFGSYDALLADSQIDAIYNPLPNSLHAAWSIRAARAGKHVLCEKPLATSAAEARAMFEAARENGVQLVEGYPYRAQPQTLKLLELVESQAIGELQLIQASFGFTLGPEPNIRKDPALAGGALMDAGSYPVSLVRMLAQRRPSRIYAVAEWAASGVDRAVAATLEFDSGLLAQVTCSFSTSVHREALIAGTGGVIRTPFLNHPPAERPAELLVKQGTGWQAQEIRMEVPALNGFRAEAEAFAARVRSGATHGADLQHRALTSPEESVDTMWILERILESARLGRPVEAADLADR